MIELPRRLIQQLRSTFRRSLRRASARLPIPLTFQATPKGLAIRATTATVMLEYHHPAQFVPEEFALSLDAFISGDGQADERIQIEQRGKGIVLRWTAAGIPQAETFASVPPVEFPALPFSFTPLDPPFLAAMAEACATTEADSMRYALDCVRLRGSDGQIAATDGHQAFLHSGFPFPWSEELLVPATEAFTMKGIREARAVAIGRTDEWVILRAAPWTIALKIDKERRFPAIDAQVPDVSAATTTLALSDPDAAFFLKAANRLPADKEADSPVTLDLNGAVVVRAKADDQAVPTDLVLRGSQRRGAELKLCTNRQYLQRAVELGFRQVHFRDNETPAFCRTDRKIYLWMLIGKDAILPHDDAATRIESPVAEPAAVRPPEISPCRSPVGPETAKSDFA